MPVFEIGSFWKRVEGHFWTWESYERLSNESQHPTEQPLWVININWNISLFSVNLFKNCFIFGRNLKLFNEKQSKIVETCEVTQSYAGRALKEAEEKWRMAQEMNASKAELEQKLCSAEGLSKTSLANYRIAKFYRLVLARFQVRETTGGDGVMAVRKQMESLSDQLKKVSHLRSLRKMSVTKGLIAFSRNSGRTSYAKICNGNDRKSWNWIDAMKNSSSSCPISSRASTRYAIQFRNLPQFDCNLPWYLDRKLKLFTLASRKPTYYKKERPFVIMDEATKVDALARAIHLTVELHCVLMECELRVERNDSIYIRLPFRSRDSFSFFPVPSSGTLREMRKKGTRQRVELYCSQQLGFSRYKGKPLRVSMYIHLLFFALLSK